ncbi:MAG TPA: dehypoxanthine futalosine cyclase, partial [Flavobacteriales bacterium]|nr:dehypoxanthine futalosine cyclase [Flavobacteriales bacterium]
MNTDSLLQDALDFKFLSAEEGKFLFENASTPELSFVANELRKIQKPDGKVT